MIYICIRIITSNMWDLIIKHNPWWSGRGDYVLERWRRMGIRWVPRWISDISLEPFSLNFVFGPVRLVRLLD